MAMIMMNNIITYIENIITFLASCYFEMFLRPFFGHYFEIPKLLLTVSIPRYLWADNKIVLDKLNLSFLQNYSVEGTILYISKVIQNFFYQQ